MRNFLQGSGNGGPFVWEKDLELDSLGDETRQGLPHAVPAPHSGGQQALQESRRELNLSSLGGRQRGGGRAHNFTLCASAMQHGSSVLC